MLIPSGVHLQRCRQDPCRARKGVGGLSMHERLLKGRANPTGNRDRRRRACSLDPPIGAGVPGGNARGRAW